MIQPVHLGGTGKRRQNHLFHEPKMPICKNLYGVCRENISKKACHAIISFWVVEGQPGIFGGIRKCRADHDPEPGQIVALVEYPTGLRDGYMLLQRYDDMSEAIINGKIS